MSGTTAYELTPSTTISSGVTDCRDCISPPTAAAPAPASLTSGEATGLDWGSSCLTSCGAVSGGASDLIGVSVVLTALLGVVVLGFGDERATSRGERRTCSFASFVVGVRLDLVGVELQLLLLPFGDASITKIYNF